MREHRVYKFKNVRNVRDFGGLKTRDGKTIRSGRIVRGGHLGEAADKDVDFLVGKLNLKKVIDLRTGLETEEKPDRTGKEVEIVEMPVISASTIGITHENMNDKKAVLEAMPDMDKLYAVMVTNDDCVAALKNILHTIVENRDGTVMWHCTEGKDRCGLVSALVLAVLDVDEDTIIEDYLYTNKTAMKRGNKYFWLVVLAYRNIKAAKRVKRMYIAKRAYIDAAFDAIKHKYGSVDDFVKNQLGITDEMKQSFKDYMTY